VLSGGDVAALDDGVRHGCSFMVGPLVLLTGVILPAGSDTSGPHLYYPFYQDWSGSG
jgi:hypothetical protein